MDVRAFGSRMSAPKCRFFLGFEGLPEVFDPGCPHESPKFVRGISGPETFSGRFFVPESEATSNPEVFKKFPRCPQKFPRPTSPEVPQTYLPRSSPDLPPQKFPRSTSSAEVPPSLPSPDLPPQKFPRPAPPQQLNHPRPPELNSYAWES